MLSEPRLQQILDQYLRNPRYKTLLIKGKWGVGKTYAIRKFFLSEEIRNEVKTFAYVSLSGVSSVTDERALAASGLERPAWEGLLKRAEWVGPVAKLFHFGEVAKSGADAVINLVHGHLLKGAIVVFDDIERKDSRLELGAVFGVISRLTEIRGAKVIVIMNEDELIRLDQTAASTLSHQREKIFDLEFEFQPTVAEALQIVQPGEIAEFVEPIAEKLGINNLRILQKMTWSAEQLALFLVNTDTSIKARLLEQVTAIAALRLRGREQLCAEHLVSASHFSFVEALTRHRRDSVTKEDHNPFRDDLEKLDFAPLSADPVLLKFLHSGFVDAAELQPTLLDIAELQRDTEFRKEREAISSLIWGKFSPLEPDELDRIEQFIDGNNVSRISAADLDFYQEILEIHARASKRIERECRWAECVILHEPSPLDHLGQHLKTVEGKEVLRKRIEQISDPKAPETFGEVLRTERLSLRFLSSSEAQDSKAIEKILRETSDPAISVKLSRILREARATAIYPADLIALFTDALSSALERIATDHQMNRIRVDGIKASAQRG